MKPEKQFPLDSDKDMPLSMVGLHEIDLGDFCAPSSLIPAKPKDPLYVEEAVCCCAKSMRIDGVEYESKSRNAGCRVHSEWGSSQWIEQTHMETTHQVVQPTSGKRK